MPKIDKEIALEMMRKGQTDSEIAARFATSRQAVNLLKKSFSAQGKLEVRRASQSSTSKPAEVRTEDRAAEDLTSGVESGSDPSYDQVTEWVTNTVRQASLVPKLQQQLEDARRELAELQSTNNLLRQQLEQASKDRASVMAKAAEYQQAIERLQASRQPHQAKA